MAVRGEGEAFIPGASAQEVFDFVLDPRQYTRADTKMIWVTKLADIPNGMLAREDGRFLGKVPGSVITRYQWEPPRRIDVTLVHGIPSHLHAFFDIEDRPGGAYVRHVEELELGHGMLGWLHDLVARRWFARAVAEEVAEIARLMGTGERGRGLAAL